MVDLDFRVQYLGNLHVSHSSSMGCEVAVCGFFWDYKILF